METLTKEQQEKIALYVQKVRNEDSQQKTEQHTFKSNETLYNQLNKKSYKDVHGIAKQYKNNLSTCKFKLVCFWRLEKGTDRPYTQLEKQQGKNRKPIPSIDFIGSIGGKSKVDHENAYNTHLNYLFQNNDRLDSAMLIVMDYIEELEHTILFYNPANIQASKANSVLFKDFKGGRYFDGIQESKYLRTDKMRFYEK